MGTPIFPRQYPTLLSTAIPPPTFFNVSPAHPPQAVLGSIDERAKQHDGAATALMADVCQPLKLLVKETTQKRQDHIKEIVAQRAELDKHALNFDKVRSPSSGVRPLLPPISASASARYSILYPPFITDVYFFHPSCS